MQVKRMANDRLMQLKFIANIFQISLDEIKLTLGEEALTMIMRRVGESVGEKIAARLKGKYTTVQEFCNLVIKDVMEPVVGAGKATAIVTGNDIKFVLESCPYKKAGFPIMKMGFFCNYTEGLIDSSVKAAFPGTKFSMETPASLISRTGCTSCVFNMKS
jgi:hypothetical protein